MKTFLVGGAVRDRLLGFEVKDRDYVVIGSSAEELTRLGYEQVGMGFPVFLHPETGEEYALARREKKVGAGYTGFEFETSSDVTLAEDLSRRDLTINSMAIDEDDHVVDPFGGLADLKARVLRHTSDAFAEDPLRVVRLARFYARYSKFGFTVAPETMSLAAHMVMRRDLDELPDERFWRELEKAFDDEAPEKFFRLLFELGALHGVSFFKRMFGDFSNRNLSDTLALVRAARKLNDSEFAVEVLAAWVAPNEVTDWFHTGRAGHLYELLKMFTRLGSAPTALEVLKMFTVARAWGEGARADDFVRALEVWEDAHGVYTSLPAVVVKNALAAARTVTSEPFQHLEGRQIGEAMNAARVEKIRQVVGR